MKVTLWQIPDAAPDTWTDKKGRSWTRYTCVSGGELVYLNAPAGAPALPPKGEQTVVGRVSVQGLRPPTIWLDYSDVSR